MHRYSLDNSIVYGPEDILLFRESPFASWMERLTLENPGHGIDPDPESSPPSSDLTRQDEVARSLEQAGRSVVLVDWEKDEASRRRSTLAAMREGADFIVNGQLAVGPLAGSVNLLSKSNGFSELGAWLYLPCATEAKTSLQSALRLCFLADLLHSVQGQLPPQMLILRSAEALLPLNTDDHIFHYLAVKHRFMRAHREFRKHRIPDPAESTHFGRWSRCARELMRERVEEQLAREAPEQDIQSPLLESPVFAIGDTTLAYNAAQGIQENAQGPEARANPRDPSADGAPTPGWISTLITATESADAAPPDFTAPPLVFSGLRFGEEQPLLTSLAANPSPHESTSVEPLADEVPVAPRRIDTASVTDAAAAPVMERHSEHASEQESERLTHEDERTSHAHSADEVPGAEAAVQVDEAVQADEPAQAEESDPDVARALADLEAYEQRVFGESTGGPKEQTVPRSEPGTIPEAETESEPLPVPEVEFSPMNEPDIKPFDGRLNTGVGIDLDTP